MQFKNTTSSAKKIILKVKLGLSFLLNVPAFIRHTLAPPCGKLSKSLEEEVATIGFEKFYHGFFDVLTILESLPSEVLL